ncbi:Ribonuclease H-like domain containing protein [Quillaja saponaria]|uniref:Ribonuclease H-like domain containing protein n=1 Tax=Quillaja saponaria TaxID=32244 RepID=A0AAD7L470_QUISA|nr:Ribonuclease H-like domain containing protein [Quillaja saponaria]
MWNRRNKCYHSGEDIVVQPHEVLRSIKLRFVEFWQVFHNQRQRKLQHVAKQVWKPTTPPQIKVNVDAAVGTTGSWIRGVVARNYQGIVLACWTKRVPSTNVEEAEIEALAWALMLAKQREWAQVAFESDSQVVINYLHEKRWPWKSHHLFRMTNSLLEEHIF